VEGPATFAVRALMPCVATAMRAIPATESNLEQTTPLVWVMVAMSVAGALITFAFLVYAVLKFRDPKTRGRRYG
jgi:heme/copper-type cytochrome/quinol oxidase subunit 2